MGTELGRGARGWLHPARGEPSHVINPLIHADKKTYDPINGFEPITVMANTHQIIVAHPSVPVKTPQELIDYAKKYPRQAQLRFRRRGSATHLNMELFPLDGRHQGGACALQGLDSGAPGRAFGPGATRHGWPPFPAAAHQGRAPGTDRAHEQQEGAEQPGDPAARRSGEGLCLRYLVWNPRPGRDAQGCHRQAACGGGQGAQLAGGEGTIPEARRRDRRQYAGEFRKLLETEQQTWTKVLKASGAKVD
ncbi:MAG: hypothetical protein IPP91_20375 [Betaproteobacteria bacterium]|nr:hypothetical protein [Betaproteobacteria bacterium]